MDRTPTAGRRRFLTATATAAVGFCPALSKVVGAAPSRLPDDALTPGQVIRFTFPELPRTLRAMNAPGAAEPTAISVRLPDNYSKDRAFPLFVFLHGGQGALGSEVE